MLELLISGFVFGRKWEKTFVFVLVSAENEVSFSVLISFSAENVKPFSVSLYLMLLAGQQEEQLECKI